MFLFWINLVNSLTYTKKNQGDNYMYHKEIEYKLTIK